MEKVDRGKGKLLATLCRRYPCTVNLFFFFFLFIYFPNGTVLHEPLVSMGNQILPRLFCTIYIHKILCFSSICTTNFITGNAVLKVNCFWWKFPCNLL